MPEGVRHRAQRPVVHGVPLEESLPTLPRLNEDEREEEEEGRSTEAAEAFSSPGGCFMFSESRNVLFYTLSTFSISVFFIWNVFVEGVCRRPVSLRQLRCDL